MGDVFLVLLHHFSSFGEISGCMDMPQIPTKFKHHLISNDQYISRDQKKTVGWAKKGDSATQFCGDSSINHYKDPH